MLSLGIAGHYIARIYEEVKGRPRFIIRDTTESLTGNLKGQWKSMINFNVPPYVDTAMGYIRECVEAQKICGDGQYTKKCNEWFEKRTGTAKCLLATSCTHATEMAALSYNIQPGIPIFQ